MNRHRFEALAARLLRNGTVASVQRLEGGVSAEVHRLDVQSLDDTRSVVVRALTECSFKERSEATVSTEFALLRALFDADLPVPEPLLLDDEGALLGSASYVMSFVDGTTEIPPSEIPSAMKQMAHFLATLHRLDPSALDLPTLPPLDDPRPGALQFLADDALGRAARALLDDAPAAAPHMPRLVHGDFWPGNVLWQSGRVAAVLDWEDATLGDPLADLACARVELHCSHGQEAMQNFTRHYLESSQAGPDPEALLVWEIYVSAAALATMAEWGLEPENEARRRKATTQFLQRAVADLELLVAPS